MTVPNRAPFLRRTSSTAELSLPSGPDGTMTRRRLLQGLAAAGGLAATGGLGVLGDAVAAGPRLGPRERVLVVVTLDGGNDALNTVVPIGDGRYRDLRGSLAITRGLLPVGDGLGLHPNLRWMKRRFDAGDVAVVLGIGEPTLDHSHFSSMARWMGGRAGAPPYTDGWCGRTLDVLGTGSIGGVAIGNQGVPLVLRRRNGDAVGLPTMGDLFGADGRGPTGVKPVVHVHRAFRRYAGSDLSAAADRLMAVQAEAIDVAVDVDPAFSPAIPASLPQFVIDMEMAARVVNLDLGARIVHVEYPGFDTHAQQRPLHDDMLRVLDQGLERFASSLRPVFADRVATIVVSEFGRRVERNGSAATDHGAAGCAFVLGQPVTGGLYGEQPSVRRLDERGDLRHSLDFRSLYTTVLDGFLGVDAQEITGGRYEKLRIFDPARYCDGELATIVGAGRIRGTARRDVIIGSGRRDRIRALGGDDVVCAGGGNDVVIGGAGDDDLFGEAGKDRLVGGRGRDRLVGGPGRDRLVRDRRDRGSRQ